MKIEPRGKFGGIKVHLDAAETTEFLDRYKKHREAILTGQVTQAPQTFNFDFSINLGKRIYKLIKEFPDLLDDKSEEKVKIELLLEKEKSEKKLALLASGQKWDKAKGIKLT